MFIAGNIVNDQVVGKASKEEQHSAEYPSVSQQKHIKHPVSLSLWIVLVLMLQVIAHIQDECEYTMGTRHE